MSCLPIFSPTVFTTRFQPTMVPMPMASAIGAPVSTTQILSSAVAGTMVVNRSGIQMSTVRTILTTWVLTLPVSMGLAIALYYFGMKLFA